MSTFQTMVTPLTIIGEFWKFIKQILGRENYFGYQSTSANQLYLLYCLCGKIYFTDKVHPATKYFWLIVNVSGLSIAYAIGLAYFLYDTRQELVQRLTIIYALGTSTNIVVVFPIISYRNRRGIEAAIGVIDDILCGRSSTKSDLHSHSRQFAAAAIMDRGEKKINVNTMLVYNCCVTLAMNCIYGVIPYLDVMIFYEDEKVKNAMYYTLPLPNIHEHGSASLFSANAALISSFYSIFALEWIAMINFILFWGVTCHNEMIFVYDQIAAEMDIWTDCFEEEYKHLDKMDTKFRWILKRYVIIFDKISRAIENYRGFVELFGSTAIPVIFLIQVVQLYTVVSMDMPFIIRLKGISFFVTAGWPMFLVYWIGQILENGTSAVSFSVYATPWYYTIKARKDVYLFLCQTQRTQNLYMFKVYSLVLKNYARLINSILSSVNLLRRLTFKHI